MYTHEPVMVEKVLQCLDIKSGEKVVDCTLGEGGHALYFLQKLEQGSLLGIEQDKMVLERACERLKEYGKKFIPVKDNFCNLRTIIRDKLGERVNKVFFDLGVSLFHFKESGRGFSFTHDEPLDMRLDLSNTLTAYEVVNKFPEKKLQQIIWAYGEERFSGRIARFIVMERGKKPITTTSRLADIVMRAIPRKYWPKNIHPATRTFQAIRIFVNDEIEILEKAIRDAVELLSLGGRICVISFHSLEDRIVKSVFRDLSKGCSCPPDFPVCVCGGKKVLKVLTRKPVVADEREREMNPSSRSALLRCAIKINEAVSEKEKNRLKVEVSGL